MSRDTSDPFKGSNKIQVHPFISTSARQLVFWKILGFWNFIYTKLRDPSIANLRIEQWTEREVFLLRELIVYFSRQDSICSKLHGINSHRSQLAQCHQFFPPMKNLFCELFQYTGHPKLFRISARGGFLLDVTVNHK